jgi:hypothetical protein
MGALRWVVLVVAGSLVGCYDDDLVTCSDGRACPTGTACDVENRTCVAEGEIGVPAEDIQLLDTPCGTTGMQTVRITNPGTAAIALAATITPSTLSVEPAVSLIPSGGYVDLVLALDATMSARPGEMIGGLLSLTTGQQEIERLVWYSTTGAAITATAEVDAGEIGPGGSVTRTFTVRNDGTRASDLTIAEINAPFSMPTTNPITLEPGTERELDVLFEPGVVMDATQRVQLSFSGSHCQPPPASVVLTGRASGDAMLASNTLFKFAPTVCGKDPQEHVITLTSQSAETQSLTVTFFGSNQGIDVSAPAQLPPSPASVTIVIRHPAIEAPHDLGSVGALLQITATGLTTGETVTKSIPLEYTVDGPYLVVTPPTVINLAGENTKAKIDVQNIGIAAEVALTLMSEESLADYNVEYSPRNALFGKYEFASFGLSPVDTLDAGALPIEGVTIEFSADGMCSPPATLTIVTQ